MHAWARSATENSPAKAEACPVHAGAHAWTLSAPQKTHAPQSRPGPTILGCTNGSPSKPQHSHAKDEAGPEDVGVHAWIPSLSFCTHTPQSPGPTILECGHRRPSACQHVYTEIEAGPNDAGLHAWIPSASQSSHDFAINPPSLNTAPTSSIILNRTPQRRNL